MWFQSVSQEFFQQLWYNPVVVMPVKSSPYDAYKKEY